jgi:hemerythrin
VNKQDWELKWTDSLSVGVPEMDQDHRQFFARVNALNKAIADRADKAKVQRLMDLMLMEAAHHFWHEQRLLTKRNYPDAKVHSEKHAQVTAEFYRLMQEFQEVDARQVWERKGLQIRQLLVDHLLAEDMKYRDFLRAQESRTPAAV